MHDQTAPTPAASADSLPTPPSLNQAPLAYENGAFLDSSEGRPVRILAEYAEPMARFRAERIEDTVVFFGSARFQSLETAAARLAFLEANLSGEPNGTDQLALARSARAMARYYEDARTLARLHSTWAGTLPGPRHRFVVTSGGGPGIMEAANRGASEAGAKTIGLNITLPFEQHPNRWITPQLSFNFHYFFMRKFWFASLAKALVIFPGGFGTFDEAFEILTLAQTGKLHHGSSEPILPPSRITIIFYGRDFWNSILNFEAMAAHGVISPRDLELFRFADTPGEAFDLLQAGLEQHLSGIPEPPTPAEPAPSPQQILGPDIARTR